MDSDQKTLNITTVGANTLARAGRARITSIQGLGIASSTIIFASTPGTAVATYKYGTEGLEVYIPGSGIKFENGIVYNLAGAGGSITVTITGA